MEQHNKYHKRLNAKSFAMTMLFALPAFSLANYLMRLPEARELAALGGIVSTVLVIPVIVWTIRRLHDANKSGWFTLALIPPFTIFLLIYALTARSVGKNDEFRFFGIRLKGAARITCAILVALVMVWVTVVLIAFIMTARGNGTF